MSQWSEENVRDALQSKQWLMTAKPIQHGIQFTLTDGSTKVNWFHTGKINVQGKASAALREDAELLFARPPEAMASEIPATQPYVVSQPSSESAPRRFLSFMATTNNH